MPFRGNRSFPLRAVGESFYEATLAELHGRATSEMRTSSWTATLILDDANRFDPDNAVAIAINGRQVGHLSRDDARQWRRVCGGARTFDCDAIIVAMRGNAQCDYGVRLDLEIWPVDERLDRKPAAADPGEWL